MDIGQSKSITPLGSSMGAQGRPIKKNAFRRFQKFLIQKRFKMPGRSRRLHQAGGIGLLRAAVLGANDGILSTSSLLLGVAAAHGTYRSILVAGIAGLVSGGMSMAASEYVSVHSQADTEEAELAHERTKLKQDNKGERQALTAIYVARGLEPLLANQVAQQLICALYRQSVRRYVQILIASCCIDLSLLRFRSLLRNSLRSEIQDLRGYRPPCILCHLRRG